MQQQDQYVLEVPKDEIALGEIEDGEVYRVAVLTDGEAGGSSEQAVRPQRHDRQRQPRPAEFDGPPVEVGDERMVEIESTGEEGDGIAKVDRGYVVVVPDASEGDKVRIEMDAVRENVGFADVVEYID
ncbi:TRAM domain-containing protein [Halobacterium noricense]